MNFYMDKIIRVVSGICDIEYDSFTEAIAASKQRAGLLRTKLNLINGKVLREYQFNGSRLILHLSNEVYAVIFPSQNLVCLDVVLYEPELDSLLNEQKTYLELPGGTRMLWNWKKILDNFIGKEIVISPSDQVLFIFFKGGDEFLITYYKEEGNLTNQYLSIAQA